MSTTRTILGLVSILILAGGIVLDLLTILSGGVKGDPINKVYFLQASTAGITGGKANIPNPARWTFFAICGDTDSKNSHCWKATAALPFDPSKNFGTQTGVPSAFVGTDKFYYLSRFMFAFYLIALFFAVVAFLLSVFAIVARLGAYLTGLTTAIALFFQALAASLMTAWTVIARNDFRKNNQPAKLGIYAYAFTWAAVMCFLISTVLFCVGGGVSKSESSYQKSSYFGRKRSTKSDRSRGSFIDTESARRVKDEYD